MGCLRVFWAALSKVFRKASLSLIPEATILATSKVCCVQYLLVFRLISGYTDERLILGLRQKDWILRALLLAVTSLWPHKVGSRGKNLFGEMEIDADFWPGQRLIKKTVWTMFRLKVWKYYEWFSEVLWLPRKSFIVWFTESVDRQISGMCGWAHVTRILCAKHKNAWWVLV